MKDIILNAERQSLITRGLGRSYGDSAQLDKKNVISLQKFNSFELDSENGLITAQAGVTFDDLLKYIVPRGFFLPVSPGLDSLQLEELLHQMYMVRIITLMVVLVKMLKEFFLLMVMVISVI